MTFTEEQIRKAVDRYCDRTGGFPNASNLIAELNRPQPEFREGEVFWSAATFKYHQSVGKPPLPGDRKLRLSELPEAVERLKGKMYDIAHEAQSVNTREEAENSIIKMQQSAIDALADFDREIEP